MNYYEYNEVLYQSLCNDMEISEICKQKNPVKTFADAENFIPLYHSKVVFWFSNIKYSIFKRLILKELEELTCRLIENYRTKNYRYFLSEILIRLYVQTDILHYEYLIKSNYYKHRSIVHFPRKHNLPMFLMDPKKQDGKNQRFTLMQDTIITHQTTLNNAIQILKDKLFKPSDSKEIDYIGKILYFGVNANLDNYQPKLNEYEKSLFGRNRFGSVTFKFKKLYLTECTAGYFLGETKFKFEQNQLFMLIKENNMEYHYLYNVFLINNHFKKMEVFPLSRARVVQWDLNVKDTIFTNPLVCIEDTLELPLEFEIQIVDHGKIGGECIRKQKNQFCQDCENNKLSKQEKFESILKELEALGFDNTYKITEDPANYTIKVEARVNSKSKLFSMELSPDLNVN